MYDENEEESHKPLFIYSQIFNKLAAKRKIFLYDDVNKATITPVIAWLLTLNDDDSTKPVTFYINSFGGVVEALLALYDIIQMIEAPVSTICFGEASSAAAILLAAGSKGLRFATPNAQIMIHQVQIQGLEGSGSDIANETRRIKVLKKQLTEILARHCGQPYRKVYRDCEADKYLSATEAKDYGLIDNIINFSKPIPDLVTRVRKANK